jgi:hypothetical protein
VIPYLVLRTSAVILALNILIAVSLFAGAVSVGLVGATAASVASGLKIGSISATASGQLTRVSVPVTVTNGGPLSLSGLKLDAVVSDQKGDVLLAGGAGPVDVPAGQSRQLEVSLPLNASAISQSQLVSLATNSQPLNVSVRASTSIQPFVYLSAHVLETLSWGAPVSGFQVGAPSVISVNSTAVVLSVPVSFTDTNGFVPVSGTASIKVYDRTGSLVGSGSLSVNVPAGGSFSGNALLTVSVPLSEVQTLLFSDSELNYTALVSFVSGGQQVFALRQPIMYDWKAPLSHFYLGSAGFSYHNSTTFNLSIPISFTDGSQFDLSGTLSAVVKNASSSQVLGSGSLYVSVVHGESFAGSLELYVNLPQQLLSSLAFENTTLAFSVSATLTTSFGLAGSYSAQESVAWGAPVGSLRTGTFTITGVNTTQALFSVPFSFADHSSFLSLSGQVSGTVYDTAGNQVGVIYQQSVSASPSSSFSGTLSGSIQASAAGDRSFVLHLKFSTQYGTFTREVAVNA